MKFRIFLLAVFVILLGANGFVVAQEDATPYPPLETCPLEDETVTIAWVPKALNNPVFEIGRVGAETRAAELSEDTPCTVEIFYVAPMNAEAEEQAQLILDLVEMGSIDAIGVSCIAPEPCVEAINAAVEAGIPVMTWDSDSPESDRLTYLGVDNFEGGQAAADLLVRAMGETGQVALLSGVEGSANLEQRIAGFQDAIAAYPDIEVVDIVYSDDLAPLAVERVETLMSDYPDLSGWFFVGLWPLLAGQEAMPQWEAATQAGTLYTVAFDTLPLELELMQEGYLHGLVGQKYWGWGYDTVTMLYEHLVYGREFEPFTNSGMDIVTPLNVAEMAEAWESNDFTQPLPDPFED